MENRSMNIVLLPDAEASDRFRGISDAIGKRVVTDIDLRRSDMAPHASLYNSAFPVDAFDAVREALRRLAGNEAPFDVTVNAASMYATYAFADAAITEELRGLHERILAVLNPLRRGAVPTVPPGLPPETAERVRTLGMVLAGPAFQPHVTVGHVQEAADHAETVRIIGEGLPISFRADTIHLVETGPLGTCKRIVESFPLDA